MMLSLGAFAQEAAHAVFLGVPLGGDREEFVDSLEEKGFQTESEDGTCTSLIGLFDGVGSVIEVHATPQSDIVHQVRVCFVAFQENEVARWWKFSEIKKKLKRKYKDWYHTKTDGVEEWSSSTARISLGTKRLYGNRFKTLFVGWQDRYGWEMLQKEKN